jgi:predicted membrane-bound spermidine synthase
MKFSLYLVVFLSGAVLMGLELVGSRILAPYFGNSIFVWGALIAVFLIALSAGYYIGGMVADKWPKKRVLGEIVIISGLLVLAVKVGYSELNEWIFQTDFGYKLNPLIASTILFLPPGIGMGMVSPFAIRLSASRIDTIGNLAGKMYAVSTLGSIVGTLGTAFFLIPMWGVKTNLLLIAGMLILIGVIVVFNRKDKG